MCVSRAKKQRKRTATSRRNSMGFSFRCSIDQEESKVCACAAPASLPPPSQPAPKFIASSGRRGSARGSWESGRRGSARRGGVTAGEKPNRKIFFRRSRFARRRFLSSFSHFFLPFFFLAHLSPSLLLHQIKLAPSLFRSHSLRASSRARPRAAMESSSAPSPASAVDFLTLLTKLKVCFLNLTGRSKKKIDNLFS